MRASFLAILVAGVPLVSAGNMTCISWSFLPGGLNFCHFAAGVFTKVEEEVVSAVEDLGQTVKDIVEFDISIHPVTILYKYITTAETEGVDAANAQLKSTGSNFTQAVLGFGEEIANLDVTMFQLSHWADFNYCLVEQVAATVDSRYGIPGLPQQSNVTQQSNDSNSSVEAARHKKRATPMVLSAAAKIAKTCLAQHFHNPFKMTIKGPNQQVGASIADIASFLVPFGAEAEGGAAASKGIDLVIPGSEDATRVYKGVEGSTVGQHFASVEEARDTAASLGESEWQEANCEMCTPPIDASIARRQDKGNDKGKGDELGRRMLITNLCCKPPVEMVFDPSQGQQSTPGNLEPIAGALKTPGKLEPIAEEEEYIMGDSDLDAELMSQDEGIEITFNEPKEMDDNPLYNPVKSTANFEVRNPDSPTDLMWLVSDLEKYQTGQLGWSTKLTQIIKLDDALNMLEIIFTDGDEELSRAMDPEGIGARWRSTSRNWIDSTNPVLKVWQDWVNQAVEDTKASVATMTDMSRQRVQDLEGFAEFFYVVPNEKSSNALLYHTDNGIMSFSASNAEGLVVAVENQGASWVPVLDNAFYCIKGTEWPLAPPTTHAVKGAQLTKGRVSIVVTVKDKGAKFATEFDDIDDPPVKKWPSPPSS